MNTKLLLLQRGVCAITRPPPGVGVKRRLRSLRAQRRPPAPTPALSATPGCRQHHPAPTSNAAHARAHVVDAASIAHLHVDDAAPSRAFIATTRRRCPRSQRRRRPHACVDDAALTPTLAFTPTMPPSPPRSRSPRRCRLADVYIDDAAPAPAIDDAAPLPLSAAHALLARVHVDDAAPLARFHSDDGALPPTRRAPRSAHPALGKGGVCATPPFLALVFRPPRARAPRPSPLLHARPRARHPACPLALVAPRSPSSPPRSRSSPSPLRSPRRARRPASAYALAVLTPRSPSSPRLYLHARPRYLVAFTSALALVTPRTPPRLRVCHPTSAFVTPPPPTASRCSPRSDSSPRPYLRAPYLVAFISALALVTPRTPSSSHRPAPSLLTLRPLRPRSRSSRPPPLCWRSSRSSPRARAPRSYLTPPPLRPRSRSLPPRGPFVVPPPRLPPGLGTRGVCVRSPTLRRRAHSGLPIYLRLFTQLLG
ncbi:hypothetical protein B0H13DRAFT_2288361 [Mycena leptocephala]|nr:hypothetical protein B0H13DRAFT_2288361 [Mycena leptocephala]